LEERRARPATGNKAPSQRTRRGAPTKTSGLATAFGIATTLAGAGVLAFAAVIAALAPPLSFAAIFALAIMLAGFGGGRIRARCGHGVFIRAFSTTAADQATGDNASHRGGYEDCSLSSIHSFVLVNFFAAAR
jgi:hypothetical protein